MCTAPCYYREISVNRNAATGTQTLKYGEEGRKAGRETAKFLFLRTQCMKRAMTRQTPAPSRSEGGSMQRTPPEFEV